MSNPAAAKSNPVVENLPNLVARLQRQSDRLAALAADAKAQARQWQELRMNAHRATPDWHLAATIGRRIASR
jgi:hypothetical protein